MPPKNDLEKDIDRWRAHHWKKGQLLDHVKIALFFVSVTCGTVASVSALAALLDGVVIGLLAGAPPLLQALHSRVSARSCWHFNFHAQLGGLYRELRFEGAEVADISHRFSELETVMASKFPNGKGKA